MSSGNYDVIVLGVGGMGGSAAFELARRGRRVLGLEQFHLGHARGSSHGQTRIIRKAYYEHPDYVPLLRRAYERWYELEQLQGRHLFTECGCLSISKPAGRLITGIRASAAQHGLPIEDLGPAELRKRFPAFRYSDEYVGVLERDAGLLAVEDCVLAYASQAQSAGADIRENEPAVSWEATGTGVAVRTARHTYSAAKLVITAGAWAGKLLGELGAPLTVMRQVLLWWGTADDALFRRDRFPCWISVTDEGNFYGFPLLNAGGCKIARHYGAPELAGPLQVDWTVRPADHDAHREFLAEHLPSVTGLARRGEVCMYTLTPDRHFILDTHPAHPDVVIAAGFSGHGFKFASVIGEVLADLAESGTTPLPIGMFRLARFASSARPAAVSG